MRRLWLKCPQNAGGWTESHKGTRLTPSRLTHVIWASLMTGASRPTDVMKSRYSTASFYSQNQWRLGCYSSSHIVSFRHVKSWPVR